MKDILLSGIIDRSMIACYCVLLIFLVRLLLKKISRKYCYYLWLVVFLNLCIPFSIVSSFSLIPQRVLEISVENVGELAVENSEERDGVQNIVVFSEQGTMSHNEEIQEVLPNTKFDNMQAEEIKKADIFSKELLLIWGKRIWILGIFLLGLKSLWTTIQLNQRIKKGHLEVLDVKERIVILQELTSPILWGIFTPTIYLPRDLEEAERTYIIEVIASKIIERVKNKLLSGIVKREALNTIKYSECT